jgi:hypothetical protein
MNITKETNKFIIEVIKAIVLTYFKLLLGLFTSLLGTAKLLLILKILFLKNTEMKKIPIKGIKSKDSSIIL